MEKKKKGVRALALALCAAMLFPAAPLRAAAGAPAAADTGVRVRDPFVLEHNGVYYMYGTGLKKNGYGCVYSNDLTHWSDPVRVYSPQGSCDGVGDWWAPECHYYNGKFYLFATYRSAATGKRGVAIFRAAGPTGPFRIITDGHVTPKNHDAIDGTLYVDETGQPWMIYVNEWTSNEDGVGDMMAAKLNKKLTKFISEPVMLFRATDGRKSAAGITDGPFLYKTKNGRLTMLWSNMNENGYCVYTAFSSNGRPDGRWRQTPGVLYEKTDRRPDGGHGMLFTAPDGALTLSLHAPNTGTEEAPTTARFVPVVDIGDTLIAAENNTLAARVFYRLYFAVIKLTELFAAKR